MPNIALDIAHLYFDRSNAGDLEAVAAMFTDTSTYSSQNLGVYFGKRDIMAMMRPFFESHEALHWRIDETEMVSNHIVKFYFTFKGTSNSGKEIERQGVEFIVVHDGFIRHIDVRNT